MRLGLLTDIHEAVELLAVAVRELQARRVEAYVMLGDVLDRGERVEETVAQLRSLTGVGVWGNHDLGLCGDVAPSVRAQFSAVTLDYFARLRPWVEFEGVRFQHIDPHLDPERLEDLWRFPTVEERIGGLRQCHHRRVCVGHLHQWGVFTPRRQIVWEGEGTFRYEPDERYLTAVHAVVDGWCAVLDTSRDELEPIRLARARWRTPTLCFIRPAPRGMWPDWAQRAAGVKPARRPGAP